MNFICLSPVQWTHRHLPESLPTSCGHISWTRRYIQPPSAGAPRLCSCRRCWRCSWCDWQVEEGEGNKKKKKRMCHHTWLITQRCVFNRGGEGWGFLSLHVVDDACAQLHGSSEGKASGRRRRHVRLQDGFQSIQDIVLTDLAERRVCSKIQEKKLCSSIVSSLHWPTFKSRSLSCIFK